MKYLEYINDKFPLYKNGTSNREIRHNFFSSIETELQAYLLGFIASDGSINLKRHTLCIHVNKKDEEIFELFKIISPNAYTQECKPTESISKVQGRTVKNKGSIRLSISSKILIEDLYKLGIEENKTYKEMKIPKQIPKSLIRHFIRGYFDGDGCITYSIRKPNPKNREINYRVSCRFEICSKLSNILIDFQKYFGELNIKTNIQYLKRNDMYNINTCSRNNIIKIFEILYNNSNFYLNRKFNKFNYYVNTEVSQIITDHRNAQEVNVNESNNPPKSVEQVTKSYLDDEYIENNYFEYLENVR